MTTFFSPEQCSYLADLAQIGQWLGAAGRRTALAAQLNVEHDDWCPLVGGDGQQQCHPAYSITPLPH